MPTYVPIIYALLHRLGVIVGNHFNEPYRGAEGCQVDCDLGDDSAYLLAEFISKCQSLYMVCVEENNFSERAKDSVFEAGSKLAGYTTIV